MLRRTLIAGLAALSLMLVALPAGAESDTDQASLTVTVPTAIDISFSDATADFGTVAPGAEATQLDTLSYSVVTNSPTGFEVSISKANSSSFDGFSLSKDDFATAGQGIVGGIDVIANNWRNETTAGTFNYQDDVRVNVPAGQSANTFNRLIDYVATTV